MNTNQTTISIRGNIIAEARNFIDNNNLFINIDDKNINLGSMLCFEDGAFFNLTGGWSAKSINIDALRPATNTDLGEVIKKMSELTKATVNISGQSFECFDDGLRINGAADGKITPFMPLNDILRAIKLSRGCHEVEVDEKNNISFMHDGEKFIIPPSKLSPMSETLYECSIPELNITEVSIQLAKKVKNNMSNENGNSLGM